MNRRISLVLFSFVAGSALAHHSVAVNFDQSSEVTVEGQLTEVLWRNPHSHLRLAAEDGGGEATEWLIELGAVNTMRRSGFDMDRIVVGESVAVTGWPGNRERTMYLLEITLGDGTRLVCAGASCEQER